MKKFPIHSSTVREFPELGDYVPWNVVKSHEDQAMKNHSQPLDRLAQRGGLSAMEIFYIVMDKNFPFSATKIDEFVYVEWLKMYLLGFPSLFHEDDCECHECWSYEYVE